MKTKNEWRDTKSKKENTVRTEGSQKKKQVYLIYHKNILIFSNMRDYK